MGSSVVGSFFIFSFSGLSVQHFGCDPYFISDLSLKHYLISNTSQAGAYQHCIIWLTSFKIPYPTMQSRDWSVLLSHKTLSWLLYQISWSRCLIFLLRLGQESCQTTCLNLLPFNDCGRRGPRQDFLCQGCQQLWSLTHHRACGDIVKLSKSRGKTVWCDGLSIRATRGIKDTELVVSRDHPPMTN